MQNVTQKKSISRTSCARLNKSELRFRRKHRKMLKEKTGFSRSFTKTLVFKMNCQRAVKRTTTWTFQARRFCSRLLLSLSQQLILRKATRTRCQRPSYQSSRLSKITCSRPWTAWHSPLQAKLSHLHQSSRRPGSATATTRARTLNHFNRPFKLVSPNKPRNRAGFTCFTKVRCTRLLKRNGA